MRRLATALLLAVAAGAGAALVFRAWPSRPGALPDPPAVAERIREAARLETLDVALYKKVTFAPGPAESGLWAWASYTFRRPRGKAIVFADAHLGLDLSRLDARSLRVVGREVWVVLPPVQVAVELRPGDTEVIGSNLDSAETARLLELAKDAFRREVSADTNLRARASGAAERAVRGLLAELGFGPVHFVDALPGVVAS